MGVHNGPNILGLLYNASLDFFTPASVRTGPDSELKRNERQPWKGSAERILAGSLARCSQANGVNKATEKCRDVKGTASVDGKTKLSVYIFHSSPNKRCPFITLCARLAGSRRTRLWQAARTL